MDPQRDSLRAPKGTPRSPSRVVWTTLTSRTSRPSRIRNTIASERPPGTGGCPLLWDDGRANQGAITQPDDVCADTRGKKPGTRWATEQLAQIPERQPRCFYPPKAPRKIPHGSLGFKPYCGYMQQSSGQGITGNRQSSRTVHGQVAHRKGKEEPGAPPGYVTHKVECEVGGEGKPLLKKKVRRKRQAG